MSGYSREIIQACEGVGCEYAIVDTTTAQALHAIIQEHYTARMRSHLPRWEQLVHCDSVHTPAGWRALASFLNDQPAFIFFDREQTVVQVSDGSVLTRILAECTGFVFYVTDAACTFVMCFNDHDMLIGCGTARAWINTLKGTL